MNSNGGNPIRVLLVDDHAMMRQVLRGFLSACPDLEVVGEAGNGEEALQSVQTLSPSVVVMDINMPRLNGIEATGRIKQAYPHVTVVGLSMNADEDYRHAMIKAGATAVLSKVAGISQLCDEINLSVRSPSAAIC
jgi:DNA-binding NarL/FixJ family response regulator